MPNLYANLLTDGACQVISGPLNSQSQSSDTRRPEGDISISASVGQNGVNKAEDVHNIQYGLDQVPPVDGGPSPLLVIDAICGPKTIDAIRKFQLKHFGWTGCDGRIDPDKQTIKKLNEKRLRWVSPELPLDLKVDAWLLADMLKHVPHTRSCIHAAMLKINSFIIGGFSKDSAQTLLVRHFHFLPQSNINNELKKIYDHYSNMLSVLDRPEAFCTLDTTDEGKNISTVAFARLGGYFNKKDPSGKIVFRRGVYFATGIPDFAAHVFIHELRHFVDRESDVGHYAKGWVTDPEMSKLPSFFALRNCDTYSNFALESRNGIMQRPAWIRSTKFR